MVFLFGSDGYRSTSDDTFRTGFFKGVLGTRCGSLEFQIGSLESEKSGPNFYSNKKVGWRRKNVLFRSFCTPMYASQLWCNFRKSCMQRLRVAFNFRCRALYNLPWRASVSSHLVQCNIPTFGLCYENTRTCFSKDAENLTTYGYVLWCSQIVCIRPYSLNTIIAFYSVNEWSNFAVSVWMMACHATMLSHFT